MVTASPTLLLPVRTPPHQISTSFWAKGTERSLPQTAPPFPWWPRRLAWARATSTATERWICLRPASPQTQRRSSLATRSEEHTSELQSRLQLVCRLLLEKKNNTLQVCT